MVVLWEPARDRRSTAMTISPFLPCFADWIGRLQRAKWLGRFQIFDARYLITLDGSRYFSSELVKCEHCLTTTKAGITRHHHDTVEGLRIPVKRATDSGNKKPPGGASDPLTGRIAEWLFESTVGRVAGGCREHVGALLVVGESLPQLSLKGGTGGVSTSAAVGEEASGAPWQPQGGLREKLNSPTVFRKQSVRVCQKLRMRVSVLLPPLPERS